MPIPEEKWTEMRKALDDFIHSPEGDAYFENIRKKNEIQKGRYIKFEKWLENNDFDKLMYRLILEHGEEWREKCWSKGCEVYMNNKLGFIFDYIIHNHESISVPQLETMFPTQIWFFKGYYFRIMHGQGSVVDIYNGDDFRHLLSA